jgi:hypothetical protein
MLPTDFSLCKIKGQICLVVVLQEKVAVGTLTTTTGVKFN